MKPPMALWAISQVSMLKTRRYQYMEKKFNKPELVIIQFDKDDIIVTSDGYGKKGDFWLDLADPDEVIS